MIDSLKLIKSNTKPTIIRQGHLAEKIVIVDGQPGCGKTMLSPIIAAMDRVELLSFAFEVEFICRLFHLKKIEKDAAIAMVRMLTDHKLYQTMMGRDTNFRFSDLSSVFQDSNPWRYFKRIFKEGDNAVPNRIQRERPILHLTTHDLLSVSHPILEGLGNRVVFIELVRHPLYMIKQQQVNMETLLEDPRDIQIYFEYKNVQLPYFAYGWQEKFVNANPMEKAIYSIQHITRTTNHQRKLWNEIIPGNIITIPFERYVIKPWTYMRIIENTLDSKITAKTEKMMKKQKVPRKVIAEGINLKVYKRYGWVQSKSKDEIVELKSRREYAKSIANSAAINVLDQLSIDYEKRFLETNLYTQYA